MKTTRLLLVWWALLMSLTAATQSLHGQTVKFNMQLKMIPIWTNGTTVTATYAGCSASASGIGNADTNGAGICGDLVSSETVEVEVEVNKGYWLDVASATDTYYCAGTEVVFSDVPQSCVMMLIDNVPATNWLSDDGGGGIKHLSVWVLTNTSPIKVDAPCGLPADRKSTAKAWLEESYRMTPPITWSIDPPDLGCSIISSNDISCIVRSGYTNGTIVLRATDAHGCFTTTTIDLIDASENTCPSCVTAVAGAGEADLGSIDVRMSLGLSKDGKSAGWLQTLASEPNPYLYSPKSLVYRQRRGDVSVVNDVNGAIRQVKAPQGLADVITSNATTYAVKFYRANEVGAKTTNGFPLIGTPTPYAVWAFENPQLTTTNRLKVTESQLNQTPVIYEYRWITNGWELDSASGLRVQAKTESWSTNAGSIYRTESTTTRQGTNAIVAQSSKQWLVEDPNEALVQETWGTGSNARTNYYEPDYNAYRQPKQIVRWDGSWDYYLYDSSKRMVTNFSSYLNQTVTNDASLCRTIVNDYSVSNVSGSGDTGIANTNGPRLVIESLKGQVVSRRYYVYLPGEKREILCLSATAAWNNASNLVTIAKTFTNGPFYGRPRSTKRPDGTMDIFYYQQADYTAQGSGALQNTTNIVMSGQPDGYETNIVDGTKTITVVAPLGQVLSRTVIDIISQATIDSQVYSDFDEYDRARKVTYLDNTFEYTDFTCCGQQTQTNREGSVTGYVRDGLRRLIASSANSPAGTLSNLLTLDAAGNVLAEIRRGTDGTLITNRSSTYDLAGRATSVKNGVGDTTSFSETIAPIIRTTTYADSSARIERLARDGSTMSVTGTAVRGLLFTNGVDTGVYFTQETKLETNGAATSEWSKTFSDLLGRKVKTLYPDSAAAYSYFNNKGQVTNQLDPDGVSLLFVYNAKGEKEYTVLDVDRDGQVDWNGSDRITRNTRSVVTGGGPPRHQRLTYVWAATNSYTSNLLASVETTVDGQTNWTTQAGLTTRTETYLDTSQGKRTVVSFPPVGIPSTNIYQHGQILSIGRGTLGSTTYDYDAHSRPSRIIDARNGTTTNLFDSADRVTTVSTPAPAAGQSSQTTVTYFNNVGRPWRTVMPDGASVTNEYLLSGELSKNSGARTYPVAYSYDYAGRLQTMTTWTNASSGGGPGVTTWKYHGQRGWLTNKLYADLKGLAYTYSAAGRFQTRASAEGVTTTYSYNNAGDLATTVYSGAVAPNVTNSYDRLGRTVQVATDTYASSSAFDLVGNLLGERYSAGPLSGLTLTNIYDNSLRRISNGVVDAGGVWLTVITNSYDSASRLAVVSDRTNSANYSYVSSSRLVGSIQFKQGTTTRLTEWKAYDNVNRLTQVFSTNSPGSFVTSNAYTYNNANQRVSISTMDNSRWEYGYDGLGQVISGKRYWSDNSPVAGQQFEYAFDDIGNRRVAASGGDQWGANLRCENYTVNNLNQQTQRTVPGGIDIIGAANSNGTVTVNWQPTHRKGDYFRAGVKVDNTASALWLGVTNIGTFKTLTNDVLTTNAGSAFVPKTPEVFGYNSDGNLTNDGRWAYAWDGENRLLSMTSPSTAPVGSRLALHFTYDPKSRRVSKVVSNYSGGSWTRVLHENYLYDDWNLIAGVNGTNSALIQSFMWGLDLSGSARAAGGVGGLLAMNAGVLGAHFYVYDGNGNVAGLAHTGAGTNTASYEYDPFGQLLRGTGPMAKANPFRFSTKYQDDESDLLYYGYRYYTTSVGRWLSRDPIGERGGRNLYCNSKNDLINHQDVLGLLPGPGWNTCVPGLILSMGPWSKLSLEPSEDWSATTKVSDSVTIVYVHTVIQNFICPCTCPASAPTVTKTVNYYTVVDADNDRGAILWSKGPTGAWPPLDPIEFTIDEINEHLYEPTPASKADQDIVDALVIENTPGPTVVGTLRSKDTPKRWCIWK